SRPGRAGCSTSRAGGLATSSTWGTASTPTPTPTSSRGWPNWSTRRAVRRPPDIAAATGSLAKTLRARGEPVRVPSSLDQDNHILRSRLTSPGERCPQRTCSNSRPWTVDDCFGVTARGRFRKEGRPDLEQPEDDVGHPHLVSEPK